MADPLVVVEHALERWVARGMLDTDTADALRADLAEQSTADRTRFGQFVVGGTGAALLLIAAGVFLSWSWPSVGPAGRTATLGVVALAFVGVGLITESRSRLTPLSYIFQTVGLALLLVTSVYSWEVWPDRSAGAVAVGLLGLVPPLVFTPVVIRRNAVMPAVGAAFGYAFLFVFLMRTVGLSDDRAIWVMDGVLALSILAFALRVRGATQHGLVGWELGAFVASLYAAFAMIIFTGLGPLGGGDELVYGLDVWWLGVTGLTLWAMHRAPPALQRDWYGRQLGYSVLAWIPLGFWTTRGAMNLPAAMGALAVGGVGGAGLAYGLRTGSRPVVVTSCLALVVAAFNFGIEEAGAIGATVALVFTAALMFRVASRLGTTGAGP